MTETRSLICVTCPMGCRLDVALDEKLVVAVEGQGCKRGLRYAEDEIKDPRRVLTTTVRVHNGVHRLLPVYTESPFPRVKIPELVAQLRQVAVEAPVRIGQVVVADALGTGINVLASRDIQRNE